MLQAVLFDLDGTVLASQKGIFRSVAYALDALSIPMPSEAELMDFLGPPLSDGFANVCHVPCELVGEAVRLYREYYNSGGKFEAEIYEGLRELLLSLRKRGIACYITTSKPRVFATDILKHFSMLDCFDGVFGSELDGMRSHKAEVLQYCIETHSLSHENIVLVGDRHFDVDGAKDVGIRCIGVLYGYGSEDELMAAGADALAQNADDLRTLLFAL